MERVLCAETPAAVVVVDGATFEKYTFQDPEPGDWTLELFGLDVPLEGDSVISVGKGTVVKIQENDVGCDRDQGGACADHGYGNTVIIEHNIGTETVYSHYSHLSSITESLKEACGPADEPEPTEETLTRRMCSTPVPVEAGEVIGEVGGTCYGETDCTTPHLHFEIKEFSDLGTDGDDAGEFGYTQNHPYEEGYQDPILYFHYASTITPTRVRVTPEGDEVRIRIGPANYRTLASAVVGQEFMAFRTSLATTANHTNQKGRFRQYGNGL